MEARNDVQRPQPNGPEPNGDAFDRADWRSLCYLLEPFWYFMNRATLVLSLLAAFLVGGTAGWFLHGTRDSRVRSAPEPLAPPIAAGNGQTARTAKSRAATPPPPPQTLIEDLLIALQDKTLTAEFRGNARDRLRMMGINRSTRPLRLSIPAGQAFEGANGSVVAMRPYLVDFRPGETRIEEFKSIATASTNRVADGALAVSTATFPKLQPLLEYVADHAEIAAPSAQTAALAILENLPASAFANFAEAGNDLPNQWDTAAFKVETADIIQAMTMMRQMGIPDEQLAITVDPQTKIEAMIDPLAHAIAMRHYGITPEAEWSYWKHELLEGDPSTRHYALHGIARYFPEVALPMLPRWAREPRTSPIFRTVAIQALAETERAEALPLLKQLESDLGPQTDLGKTAHEAVRILDGMLNHPAANVAQSAVVFRMTKAPGAL